MSFEFELAQRSEPIDGIWVIVEFQDDWGCVWESRRYLEFRGSDVAPTATMLRRIVELPPPRGTA
jgi:hypothetical protein